VSDLHELIAALRAHDTEFKALDEVGSLYGGLTGKSKADFADGNARFVTYVNVFQNRATNVSPDDTVRIGEGERQNRVRYGDVLFTASSEGADEIGMASAVTVEPREPLYLNSFCFGLRPNTGVELDPDFAKYLFRSTEVRRQIIRTANGVTRINLSKEKFRAIKIPMPPLGLQRKIAEVLDELDALEAELRSELDAEMRARRRQYEYYRDSLLTAARGVRWTTMAEVGTFTRGRRFTKADAVSDGIGSIHYGEIYTHYGTWATETLSRVRPELAPGLRFARTGDVVIAAVGETVDDVCKAVAWLGDEDVAVHDDCFIFRHSLNPKFVSYYVQTGVFRAEKAKHVTRAKVKRVSGESLARLKIPVPPLDEQERIVAILDEYAALVNDLSIDLPSELNARQQQYEHYRDRLLTFSEAA
jgi:type I restriction enzyme, S subunit